MYHLAPSSTGLVVGRRKHRGPRAPLGKQKTRDTVQLSITQRNRFVDGLQRVVAEQGTRAKAVAHLACSRDAFREILAGNVVTRISRENFLYIAGKLGIDVSGWDVCCEF